MSDPCHSKPSRGKAWHWIVLAMSCLVVFTSLGLARFGYSMILPSMQHGLGLDNTQAGLLATANLMGYLLLAALGGALASRFGPRAVITAGLLVVGMGMLGTGMASGMGSASFWRGFTGLGSGASNVPVMGLISAWFGASKRGLAAGVAVSGSSLALIVLGPVVPAFLQGIGDSGWRACWFALGAAALVITASAFLILRNDPKERGLLPLGAAGSEPTPSGQGMDWAKVYTSGLVWHLGLVYVAFGFSYIIYMTFFIKTLIADGGYSTQKAGSLFMTMGWCSLLCGVIWGAVSDAIGRKQALICVYLIHTLAFGLFAFWPTPQGYLLSAVLFGLSAWSIPAIMAAACGDVLGPRMAPAALGFITLFFGLGQAAGPSVAGAMADASGSFASAFWLASGVAFSGAVMAFFLKIRKPDSPVPEKAGRLS